ncbi:MAG TPA: Spy/CpxP family protein refolding chaperone [Acetobacteraceae bacterium]|nr:Spy/CpxP family protein refolding chaperone [Acetobacteraceae bacterium]
MLQQGRSIRRFAVAAVMAVLAGGTGVALGQPGGMGMMGGSMGGGAWGGLDAHRGGGDMASYLDALKAQLVITREDEPRWKQYAETVSGAATQMQGLHQAFAAQMPQATWAQRRERMNQMFQARQQAFDTVHAAAEKLLATLDPQQRATAGAILPGLGAGGMMGGGAGRPSAARP